MKTCILNVTALAEVFPDGQKITAAAVEFDREIDPESLSRASFSVKDRTITKIYPNAEPARATQGTTGKFVILELALEDAEARVLPHPSPARGPRPPDANGPGEPPAPYPKIPLRIRKPLQLTVTQLVAITAADGTLVPLDGDIVSSQTSQLLVDDFQQCEFKGLPYNLFIPKDYDAKSQYPLVMFIADASANSDDPFLQLVQGRGAVVWATPEEQTKHPCFVLAPQVSYGIPMTRDDFTVSQDLETIKELLDDLVRRYSIDPNRIYTTGQSQGCMASCELNIRYPDFFAASLLVSGQWNPETMAATLTQKNLFIALSEGGPKEFPGMNAVVAALEKAGAKVARARLNARQSKDALDADVRELIATGANILYVVYDAQTVLPNDGKAYPPIRHHSRGWEITYEIEAVRDWLLSQVKSS